MPAWIVDGPARVRFAGVEMPEFRQLYFCYVDNAGLACWDAWLNHRCLSAHHRWVEHHVLTAYVIEPHICVEAVRRGALPARHLKDVVIALDALRAVELASRPST